MLFRSVFTESELRSRYEILLEGYCKTLHIEALTMVDMVKREIIPACVEYQNSLVMLLGQKKACGDYPSDMEAQLLAKIAKLSACLMNKLQVLEDALLRSKEEQDIFTHASFYRDHIFAAMSELRVIVDELETVTAKKYWPFPAYAEMLYSVI